jgi:hypothetical protein
MGAKTGFLYRAKNPADLTRTIRTYFAGDLYENLETRRSQIREFASERHSWTRVGGRFWIGFIDGCLRNKWSEQKNLLAMTIDSDTNKSGASRGTISRNCENSRNPTVYAGFERFFRPALWSYGLPFQRVGGKCAGFASSRARRRYDHAPRWNL